MMCVPIEIGAPKHRFLQTRHFWTLTLLQMIIDDFKSLDVLPYDFRQNLLGEYIDKENIKTDAEVPPLVKERAL